MHYNIFSDNCQYLKQKLKKETFVLNASAKKGVKIMEKEKKLLECQKDFLFNSEYKLGHLNEDEKLLYLSCEKTNKGVGAYIGDVSKDDYLTIAKKIFELISSRCEDCKYRM